MNTGTQEYGLNETTTCTDGWVHNDTIYEATIVTDVSTTIAVFQINMLKRLLGFSYPSFQRHLTCGYTTM